VTIEAGRSFDGHVLTSADARWLYTPETDAQGQGWLAVRELDTLRKAADWLTHSIDPHHLVLDADGDCCWRTAASHATRRAASATSTAWRRRWCTSMRATAACAASGDWTTRG
jgi:hypothetical protein